MQVHWIALVAFAGIALATIAVGIYATRVARTTHDVYIASRAVGPVLNASAISGEYLSAASFLGIAGMVMSFGYDVLWYPAGYAAGYLFLLLFIAAPLRRFGAYTIPDFAEGRFGSPTFRRIAMCFVLLIGIFYMLPQMKGAGVAVQTIAGLPYWVGVVVVGSVITLNVALGGMKGITFVQAFQFWVKAFAISVPAFVLLAVFGSYSAHWEWATSSPPPALQAAIEAGAPGSAWGQPFGPLAERQGQPLLFTYSLMIATVFGTAGLPHILVRFYTNRDGHTARQTTLVVLAMIGLFYLFPPILGLLGRVHAPDLYLSGRTDALLLELPGRLPDRLLGELLRAVTAAGAFAAFMSTTSGLLVAVAGALAHDLYARTLHPRADLRERLRAFRFAALLAGAVAMAISLGIERFHINMLVGWAFAIAASAFFPLLVLGIWWRRLTVVGAAAGTLVGGGLASAAILYTMWAGDPLLPATTWSTLLAQPAIWTIPVSFGTMVLGSLLTPHRVPPDVNLKMLRLHVPETLGLRTDYIGE
ncbi:MAG TPA: cation acetate symporter [Chloroflexota bacterium]|nr:cation acetate symporter [Chloroflexota bacterium]